MDEDAQISGKNFRAIRKRLRLSQEELAQQVGMTAANVRRVEKAETTTIRDKSFRMLAVKLGVSLEDLAAELSPANGTPGRLVTVSLEPPDYERLAGLAGERTVADLAREMLLKAIRAAPAAAAPRIRDPMVVRRGDAIHHQE